MGYIIGMIKDDNHSKGIVAVDNIFWKRYKRILSKAMEISDDRQPSYVGDCSSILDYWINGENDLLYEINKKNKRLIGLHRLEAKPQKEPQKTADKIEDTLVDMINYCAYLLSLREMIAKKENIIISEYSFDLKKNRKQRMSFLQKSKEDEP